MDDTLLILNAGSSSVKLSVFGSAPGGTDDLPLLMRGQIESLDAGPVLRVLDGSGRTVEEHAWSPGESLTHADATDHLLARGRTHGLGSGRVIAAGHRVVHGGCRYSAPVRIDDAVIAELEALAPLAPLHQPHNLAAIAAVRRHAPDLPQVACFDTAFHRSQPEVAQRYALPRRWTESGIRGYGFHGLSYEYIAGLLPALDPVAAAGATIVAHLGNGASLCAIRAGRSVATTMGFSALDGLVMGTRCGSIDPGALIHLQRHAGLSVDALERLLYFDSGLFGVSGISGDVRTLLASNDTRAREAIELFVYRASRAIGSLAAALGGLDALVFTGGIGENAAEIRSAICTLSAWLGVELDETADGCGQGARRVHRAYSRVSVWVIPTNEELMIARHTAKVVRGNG